MSKTIVIKLTEGGENIGPFTLYDGIKNIIETDIPFSELKAGRAFVVDDDVTSVTLESTGDCKFKLFKDLKDITKNEYQTTNFETKIQSCIWRHLTDTVHYNYYYNHIRPYIIEYPFSYSYLDEILQNVQDYTKVYSYTVSSNGVFNNTLKVQPNDKWFNKAILYNDQQSSGLLLLEAKPVNNLKAYNSYPKYNTDSKTINFTKTDNFYQYNLFWNVVKDPLDFLFKTSCESLSIDKVLNQDNMDYSTRSFNKDPLRAKDLKIRHILDNTSLIHLVSQFIVSPSANSYK
jgi:hypothetical protein